MKDAQTIQFTMYPDGRMDGKNAAAYLGLSQKTLSMMRCAGDGPKFIKLGRIFYFKEDLDEWIARAGRFTSTAQAAMRAAASGRSRFVDCRNNLIERKRDGQH